MYSFVLYTCVYHNKVRKALIRGSVSLLTKKIYRPRYAIGVGVVVEQGFGAV